MDFIGNIGGVQGILIQIAGWVFGGYAAFHSAFQTISVLYKIKGEEISNGEVEYKASKKNDPDRQDVKTMKLSLIRRIIIYILKDSLLSYICCCCKSAKTEKYIQIMETGEEKLEEDFNIYNIINNYREMRFEIEQIKKKLNLVDDPIF